ncbi:hypothetical protein [Pseudomonas phage HU1]|nr:hypothetical protein [Pseudomonas phage HU1]
MSDYINLQSRCQRGDASLSGANNLLAECHAALGKLIAENDRLREDPGMRAILSLRGDCADLIAERDQLKAENEALMKTLDRYTPDPSGSKLAAIYAAAHGHLCEKNIFDESAKSQALDAVFALRKLAAELRGSVECHNMGHCKAEQHELGEPCKVLARIDAAMGQGEQS